MGLPSIHRRKFLSGFVLVGALGASIGKLYAAYGNPKTWALTVGTTSQQLLANNGSRKGLIFHNPNAAGGASVALCSAYDGGPAGDGVAVINGNGCITVPPGAYVTVNEVQWTGAINGIASSSSTAFTILEF
jgi:hypothetical protein